MTMERSLGRFTTRSPSSMRSVFSKSTARRRSSCCGWPTLRIPAPVAKAGAWIKDKMPAGDEEFIKPWMIDLADANYPVNAERARRRFGWQPRHRLRDALGSMVKSLERDPERWCEENGLPLDEDEA